LDLNKRLRVFKIPIIAFKIPVYCCHKILDAYNGFYELAKHNTYNYYDILGENIFYIPGR